MFVYKNYRPFHQLVWVLALYLFQLTPSNSFEISHHFYGSRNLLIFNLQSLISSKNHQQIFIFVSNEMRISVICITRPGNILIGYVDLCWEKIQDSFTVCPIHIYSLYPFFHGFTIVLATKPSQFDNVAHKPRENHIMRGNNNKKSALRDVMCSLFCIFFFFSFQ